MVRCLTFALALVAAAQSARAERWYVIEAPAAIAVSEPQSGTFQPGVLPALGAYDQRGPLALGARLRLGVLRDGHAPGAGLADPGMGGVATASVALRIALGPRGWLEGAVGEGLTGGDRVQAFEVGVGWDVQLGWVDLGPSLRYLALVNRAEMAAVGGASLVLLGLDVRLGKARPARTALAPAVVPVAAPPPPPVAPPPPVDRDPDVIVDREVGCAADAQGCEVAAHVLVTNDRIILEERVLFETDRAVLRPEAREAIAQILAAWRQHPAWRRLTIEGHADMRGTDLYNLELSRQRADAVRVMLIQLGADAMKVDALGYGRARPRDLDTTEAAHQHNRRVEFVIEREPATGPTP
jgi:outer membrane protein OmpA-like peptidoglycan-associated protein